MKNKLFLTNNKAQAAVELTILGTLILLCFSMILMYGQRLELENQLKMEAFRKALKKAYDRNSSVSYTVRKEARFFNLFSGFGQGQEATLAGSASVMWQKGIAGDQDSSPKGEDSNFAFYEINDMVLENSDTGLPRKEKDTIGFDGSEHTVRVPVSVYKEEGTRQEAYDSSVTKQEESSGKIRNVKTSDLTDTVTTTLYTRFDNAESDARISDPDQIPLPEYEETETLGPHTYGGYLVTQTDAEHNQDTNRIEYSEDKVGTEIHRERTWETEE